MHQLWLQVAIHGFNFGRILERNVRNSCLWEVHGFGEIFSKLFYTKKAAHAESRVNCKISLNEFPKYLGIWKVSSKCFKERIYLVVLLGNYLFFRS